MKGLQSQECKQSKLLQLRQLLPRHALLGGHMLLQAPHRNCMRQSLHPFMWMAFLSCAHIL